jgi:hypothetical protein
MKMKTMLLMTLALLIVVPVPAQDSSGFSLSRWGGILAVAQNPANVFSPDLKYDVHLFSIFMTAENNYLALQADQLFSAAEARDILKPEPKGQDASVCMGADAIGPSFLIRISAKDALAFSSKDRAWANVDGIPVEAADMLYDVLLGEGANNYSFASDYTSLNFHNWIEYAFSYGRQFLSRGPHRLQAGATFKLLQGVSAYALTVRDFQSQLEIASDLINRVTADVTYGHTQNLTWGNDSNGMFKNEAMGVGFDFGVVYEYHPAATAAGGAGQGRSSEAVGYKFKVGLAVLDLGSINYEKKLGCRDFTVDVDVLDIVVFDEIESQADINEVINSIDGVTAKPGDMGRFAMNLPARISATLDFQALPGLYLNLNPVIALNGGRNDSYRNHLVTQCGFSLRYEKRWLGIIVPGAVGGLGGFRLGLGVKAGPLLVGSSSLLSFLLGGQVRSADFFVGLRIPLGQP